MNGLDLETFLEPSRAITDVTRSPDRVCFDMLRSGSRQDHGAKVYKSLIFAFAWMIGHVR